MDAARLQLMHDLGGGEERDLDAVEPLHHAAIAALVSGLAQGQSGALEEGGGVVLEASLGGDGDGELRGHQASPLDRGEQALGVNGRADRRDVDPRADRAEQPVIAPATGDRALFVAAGFDLEHEAGIIFEVAAKLGGEARLADIDAALLEQVEAAGHHIERRPKVDAGPLARSWRCGRSPRGG